MLLLLPSLFGCVGTLLADPEGTGLSTHLLLQARWQASRATGVGVGAVELAPLTTATPGIAILAAGADIRPTGAGLHHYVPGIVVDGRVTFDLNEGRKWIVQAWGYGAARTVPPEEFARVMLATLPAADGPSALKRSGADPRAPGFRRAQAAAPWEDTIDGLPAVIFWFSSGDVAEYEITATVAHDGTVDLAWDADRGG